MVVGQDHGRRVEFQGPPDDLARVDGCPVDRPVKQILRGDQPVPVVKEQTGEDLGRLFAEVDNEIVRNRLGAGEHGSAGTAIR